MRWIKTLLFIIRKHKGQKDKSGLPYFLHPLNVSIHCRGHDAKIAGLLHDVIEDTETDADELVMVGYSKEIVEAVKLLTRVKGEPYQEYIMRVKENPLATEVKKNDLRHNMNLNRLKEISEKDVQRVRKYEMALKLLTE